MEIRVKIQDEIRTVQVKPYLFSGRDDKYATVEIDGTWWNVVRIHRRSSYYIVQREAQ